MDEAIDPTLFARASARASAGSVREAFVAANLDDSLVARCTLGDDDAFRQLVERYQTRLYRFCCQWLPDAEDAREAVQDTFVQAYEALPRYRSQGRFSAWIYRIALNQCRDRHRSRAGRQRRLTTALPETPEGGEFRCSRPAPDELAARACDWERLRRGIAALPRRLREIAILRGVEGLSEDLCAEILGTSKRAVEGRYYRARRELATWLEREAAAEASRSAENPRGLGTGFSS